MILLHFYYELLVILITLVTSSISEEFANAETRWTLVREFVDPVIVSRHYERHRRSTIWDNDFEDNDEKSVVVLVGNWSLETFRNDRLVVSPKFEVHWARSTHRKSTGHQFFPPKHYSECDPRQGRVLDYDDSIVALTICSDEFYVMIRLEDHLVFYVRPTSDGRHVLEQMKIPPVEPLNSRESLNQRNPNVDGASLDRDVGNLIEILKKPGTSVTSAAKKKNLSVSPHSRSSERRNSSAPTSRKKRAVGGCPSKSFYNLTGDTIALEGDPIPINVEDPGKNPDTAGDDFPKNEREVEMKDSEEHVVDQDGENVGYFYDRTWEKTKLPRRKLIGKTLPPRWLELGIAIDYSVINFHGQRVQQYVLALLNIVSAIYKDPSLDSNLRLVIVRMIFYSEKSDGMVRQGNARKSLENVNKWNRKLLSSADENHDVAVWLTRLDIGGPSGYAPVGGACDPARSCALNRDEGLTSAFIIAHEVAHILGLTHDGDETAGNTCGEEALMGSVMAPMVAATFHRFHWSSCSRKEFHRHIKHFQCLDNKPSDGNSTHLGKETARETFTMDEQCRMEFGEGYALCRSFELPGPCSHLWCGHTSVSEVCKTKKGPPLEGTVCGKNKWCINGYCESVDRKRFGFDRLVNKPRNGGWSSWTAWGKCSRSCGVGVRFRFRQCNEPTPAHGGRYCEGNSEDYTTCELANCSTHVDLRQQQCLRLPVLVRLEETSPKFSMTWLPHEPHENHLKCRISCRSAETGEIFLSQESLTDGTPCSYGATDICVQGTCRRMGCDKIFNSETKMDSCGVCNGDDTTCSKLVNKFNRKIRRGMTRVAIVPRGSYNVSVNVTMAAQSSLAHENLTFTIRDRRRRRNDLVEFDSSGLGQISIVEGAAFRSRRFGDAYEIWTRGPVLAEIVISLAVPEASVKSGVTISVVSRYIVNRKDSIKKTKYSWLFGGWSACSAHCGGGTRHKMIACKDDETGKTVNRRKCSLLMKPMRQVEKCNNFGCQVKWIPGLWQECSATCGTQGIQHRDLFCVNTSFVDKNVTNENELTVYKIMVSPMRCKGERRPQTKRECNRIACPGNWIFNDWSSSRNPTFANKIIART
ncbi:A disintegrin and metalloproteinase with thrombospondin motifs 2-like [Venturia canescens]|uniref:A disintegrin and metalloproteinase with thrombospondin motifs 2-like n=1 Tax=Venturia canescens TaxID=32260 RepID=UPI001C9CE38B|nr:A disintegrin and metalloproteinase with thrombospondin motifs 2-like [Venturia canescens]